jgi:hypothetical protein
MVHKTHVIFEIHHSPSGAVYVASAMTQNVYNTFSGSCKRFNWNIEDCSLHNPIPVRGEDFAKKIKKMSLDLLVLRGRYVVNSYLRSV